MIIKSMSSILVLLVMFFNISFSASAISISCVESHFTNLVTTGAGEDKVIRTPPSENTCPYVALSLLLSFYDAYWNDKFVADENEWQQGSYDYKNDKLNETFAPILEATDWDNFLINEGIFEDDEKSLQYKEYATENASNYLEPYLISIGIGLDLHSDSDETLGLYRTETYDVLSYYLYNVREFTTDELSIHLLSSDQETLINVIKQQLDNGYPVIYGGSRVVTEEDDTSSETNKKAGHVMVAYSVTEDGNDINLHTGWSENEHTTITNSPYNINNYIIWIEINEENLPHTHSYSYTVKIDGVEESVCSCQIYSKHRAHNHYYFTKNDKEKRYEGCVCGDIRSILHYHSKTYSNRDNSSHYERCSNCNYKEFVYHNYYLESISSTQHQQVCECGSVGTISSHVISRYVKDTGLKHKMYCECGYNMGTGTHSIVTDSPSSSHCIYCGAVFNPLNDFIIYKKESKYEDE